MPPGRDPPRVPIRAGPAGAEARRDRLRAARLYLILHPDRPWEPTREAILRAVEGGVEIVQLRDKGLAESVILLRAARLVDLARSEGFLAIVNDRPDLASRAGADGAHVGQEDLCPTEARRQAGDDRLLGVSTHSIEQVRQGVKVGADYLGFGPVFPTRTKGYGEGLGAAALGEALREAARLAGAGRDPIPVFALGGVTAGNLPGLVAAGCGRVAVTSAILDAPDPRSAARALRRRLEEA